MKCEDLKLRTKRFALRVIRMTESIPQTTAGGVISRQLVRCATSVGANYRAACRGRSTEEFVAKLQIVVEQADECCYWIELLIEGELLPMNRLEGLLDEANQITAIMVSSRKTAMQPKAKN
ncbi:MAG: four helix bundle protein [Planctomycetota bacterium]